MFTGIVEETGTVRSLVHPDEAGTDAVLTVVAPLAASDARLGDSIAVDGVCLTVTDVSWDDADHPDHAVAATAGRSVQALHAASSFVTFEVMPESLRRSTLGALAPGARVNLERALPANGRLGGHVVQGHVDGAATLVARDPGPRWDELMFTAPAPLLRYVAEKGSIALNGVSLTVTHVSDDDGPGGQGTFGVSLIPTTLDATNLGALTPGAPVNVEVDVLAKYAERLLTSPGVRARTAEQAPEQVSAPTTGARS